MAPAPDGSVWGTQLGYPGALTQTRARVESPRHGARGDLSTSRRQGILTARQSIATAYGGMASGHLASSRSPQVQRRAERSESQRSALSWKDFYTEPAPQFKNVTDSSTEGSYYMGRSVRHAGTGAQRADQHRERDEALLALKDGKFVTMRVPYPFGFYTNGWTGIDDPNAGWKGRGIWTTISTRTPFHMETRKDDEQGDEVPDASRPAREVVASWCQAVNRECAPRSWCQAVNRERYDMNTRLDL